MHTILIVDDEPLILDMLTHVFHQHDFDVLTASDGIDALDILAQRHADVVLSDFKMPRLDGAELNRSLQNSPQTRDMPVILMSASPEELRAERAYQIIAKPFFIDKLLQTVNRAIRETISDHA